MSGRLKLKSIYPTFEEFSTFCMDTITEFYPRLVTDMPNSVALKSEIERYVFKPLYRQFKNATCRYLPTEEGIDAFNNQFSNQLEEVVFDFLVYTSTNLHYFNESYTKVGENLEQGVTTYNSPINQDITNTKSNTTIAKGATAQNINLMVYNGNTSWLKAFSSYYTPQRKAELIDKFRWLFISFYVGSDEGVTLVELSEALSMANGDMVITPEEAEILRKVIIEKPSTLIPENIKKGVDIGGVIGTLEEGGASVEVPPVTNLAVDENKVLTFTKPDVTNLIEQGATISYLVTINDTTIEVEDSVVNISSYLGAGINNISVVVKAMYLSNGVIIEYESGEKTITTLETTLPQMLYRMGCASVGNNAYLFGGIDSSNKEQNTIYKFDSVSETLTTLETALPKKTYDVGVCGIGTNVYIFGGENIWGNTYRFDSVSETLTTLEPNINGLSYSGFGVGVVGTNAYIFGGHQNGVKNWIMKFDSVSETLTTLAATLQDKVRYLGVGVVGSNIYTFGGDISGKQSLLIQKFDTASETITTLDTKLPRSLMLMGVCGIGTNVYIFGGTKTNYKDTTDTIYNFDSVSETLSTLETALPQPLYGMGIYIIGTNTYIFGGKNDSTAVNTIYKFN